MKFITFEGIEGSGKSTQIELLKNFFKERSLEVVFTKEPGSSKIGSHIREILLNKNNSILPYTELFLILADRIQHVHEIIEPELKAGNIVVSDRYIESSIAYQGQREGLDKEEIINFIEKLNLPVPDITFLLDLPVEHGLDRAKKRASLDRFESEDISFHKKIRSAYLEMYDQNPSRIIKIDASLKSEEVFEIIKKNIKID